ncbi:hypothetical protein ACQPYH_28235 [Kribbella sp. CA-245084]|uniref:hypothetical protein n=1 Tax=Kribbella sp. CA-245084 TaxID=3239940 RepID=UPI003D8F43DD
MLRYRIFGHGSDFVIILRSRVVELVIVGHATIAQKLATAITRSPFRIALPAVLTA